ncbi:MAG: hypothetical protein PHO66_00870 [Eubacteriales bacterium]|nr:hypothetical protein [Eubacteriales bacterium]
MADNNRGRLGRAQYSALNVGTNLLFHVLKVLVGFVARRVFLDTLGVQYLGVNQVFTQIINVFSLTELGIGTAILFSLYAPLADNDTQKVAALLGLYRTLYRRIAAVVAALGLAMLPFLPLFLDDDVNMLQARLVFLLFVANAVISYLYVYKANVINADQRGYVVGFIRGTATVLLNLAQIAVLLITRSFFLYALVNTLSIVIQNVLLSRRADTLYPYIRQKDVPALPAGERKALFARTRAVFLHDIGGICVNSTDNIILNVVKGNVVGGLYSNYAYVTAVLRDILRQIFAGVTASVGNLIAAGDRQRVLDTYRNLMFLDFWIYGFASAGLLTLLTPLVALWMGEDMVMSAAIVTVLVINFYLGGMRECSAVVKSAAGMFAPDRYMPLVESAINLVASIVLVNRMGVIGIFIGTAISTLAVPFWVQPLVVHRLVLKAPMGGYWLRYAQYLAAAAAASAMTYLLAAQVTLGSAVAAFAVKLILCLAVPNALFALLFFRTPEFGYFMGLMRELVAKLSGFLHRK